MSRLPAKSSLSLSSTPASNILSDELFITPYDAVRKPISMLTLPTSVIIAPISVEKALRCSICCRLYDKAQTSNVCSHSFCEHCITEYLRKGNKECPNCRMKLISRRSLRSNALLDGIVKTVFSNRAAFEARLESFSKLCGEGNNAPTTRSATVFQNRNNSRLQASMDGNDADDPAGHDVNLESLCEEIMICLLPHPDMHACGLAETCRILPERGISAPHYIAVEWRADLQPSDIALTLLMPTKAWSGDSAPNDDAVGRRPNDVVQAIFKNAALRFAFASKTCLFTKSSKTSDGAGSGSASAVFIPFTSMRGVTSTAGDDLLELYYLTPSLSDVVVEAAKFNDNVAKLDCLTEATRITGVAENTENNNTSNNNNTGEKPCENGGVSKTKKREFQGSQWLKSDRSRRNSRSPSLGAPDEIVTAGEVTVANVVLKKKQQYRRRSQGKVLVTNSSVLEATANAVVVDDPILPDTQNDAAAAEPLAFILAPPALIAAAALLTPDAGEHAQTASALAFASVSATITTLSKPQVTPPSTLYTPIPDAASPIMSRTTITELPSETIRAPAADAPLKRKPYHTTAIRIRPFDFFKLSTANDPTGAAEKWIAWAEKRFKDDVILPQNEDFTIPPVSTDAAKGMTTAAEAMYVVPADPPAVKRKGAPRKSMSKRDRAMRRQQKWAALFRPPRC